MLLLVVQREMLLPMLQPMQQPILQLLLPSMLQPILQLLLPMLQQKLPTDIHVLRLYTEFAHAHNISPYAVIAPYDFSVS